MSVNIFDLVKGYITPELVNNAATTFGESESGISKALSAFIPLVLGGLINKHHDSPNILDQVKQLGSQFSASNDVHQLTSQPLVQSLLASIFGEKQNGIVSKIAEFAGISDTSSNQLLNLAAALGFGGLGKYANDQNLNTNQFSDLLGSSSTKLAALLPTGLSLGALGLGGLGNLFDNATETISEKAHNVQESVTKQVHKTSEDVKEKYNQVRDQVREEAPYQGRETTNEKGGGGFLKWFIPLVILLLIGYLLYNWLGKKEDKTLVEDPAHVENTGVVTTPTAREEATYDLDGLSLVGYKGGLEDQLVNFIKSDEYKNGTEESFKDRWFNFDNVNFVFGTTDQLEPGSEKQLNNLASILKKFPDAKIKIGAYTDKVGDDANNKELSQKRADFLKAELGKLGVGQQVVAAEGYGEEFATVPETASDEERAADRKMALRFTK
ncbi:OmpA family protein [Vaginella massiliensis]|uniref:OmpA family protein n=1 Tax=Vaginella massiliensis TaxID=1816680 RepID=UPI000838A948|nr:OmpA family protein [Vaginella massiliensis]